MNLLFIHLFLRFQLQITESWKMFLLGFSPVVPSQPLNKHMAAHSSHQWEVASSLFAECKSSISPLSKRNSEGKEYCI